MIHTASLLHDDVLDHAETRRGKPSVNVRWDARRSTFAGDYILAVGSRLLAAIRNPDVVEILSQVTFFSSHPESTQCCESGMIYSR